MKRKVPGTSALIAFEASARHGSFSRAALELSVTEGAISRQIARLETQLETTLFTRRGNRIELSRHGVTYAAQVRGILARLEEESLRLVAQPLDGGTLELAVIPTFASRWLIPRLKMFQALHPNITVNLSELINPTPLPGSSFDAAVHFDHPAWVGHQVHHLFEEVLIPICRPGLIEDLAATEMSVTLLHKRSTPDAWRDFIGAASLPIINPVTGPRYELFSMLITAAIAGLGVALVPRLYVEAELAQGILVTPWASQVVMNKRYVLVTQERVTADPVLAAFVCWILDRSQKPDVYPPAC